MKAILKFFRGVRVEMKRVRWPKLKELSRYSTIVITFVVFFGGFFYLTTFVYAAIKSLIG
jgi:preprotein translocase subunit SecE